MKGGITMRVSGSDFDARLAALEGYVDMPTQRTGMTVTGRLDAQHRLLEALRADVSDLQRGMGKALHGIAEIKNLLTRLVDPTGGHGLNGSSPPRE